VPTISLNYARSHFIEYRECVIKDVSFLLLNFHMKRIIKNVSFYIVTTKMLHGEVSTTRRHIVAFSTRRRLLHGNRETGISTSRSQQMRTTNRNPERETRISFFFLVKLHSTWSLLTILHVYKFDFMGAIEYTFLYRDELISS